MSVSLMKTLQFCFLYWRQSREKLPASILTLCQAKARHHTSARIKSAASTRHFPNSNGSIFSMIHCTPRSISTEDSKCLGGCLSGLKERFLKRKNLRIFKKTHWVRRGSVLKQLILVSSMFMHGMWFDTTDELCKIADSKTIKKSC